MSTQRPHRSFATRVLPVLALGAFALAVLPAFGTSDGGGFCFFPATAGNGRFVAFTSLANNLVAGDANAQADIFLRDTKTGVTTLESVGSGGTAGDASAAIASISANGRWVAFDGSATNLVEGDTNGVLDVFVRDRKADTTERVSVGPAGEEADGASFQPVLSANGRFVAFASDATNLVAGDTNGHRDIFLRDLKHGVTTLVSVSTAGTAADGDSFSGLNMSANGRWIAFASNATNLVEGDGNGVADVFVHDRVKGTTVLASVTSTGGLGNGGCSQPAVSSNGRWVAWQSSGSNFVPGDDNGSIDIFVRDLKKGVTTCATVATDGTVGDGFSLFDGGFSSNGRWITFHTAADDILPGDTNSAFDVAVRDLKKGVTFAASVSSDGALGDDDSFVPALSANGRQVALVSLATNLTSEGGNALQQIYEHDVKTGATICVSLAPDGSLATTLP